MGSGTLLNPVSPAGITRGIDHVIYHILVSMISEYVGNIFGSQDPEVEIQVTGLYVLFQLTHQRSYLRGVDHIHKHSRCQTGLRWVQKLVDLSVEKFMVVCSTNLFSLVLKS